MRKNKLRMLLLQQPAYSVILLLLRLPLLLLLLLWLLPLLQPLLIKSRTGAVPNTDSTQRSGAKYPVRSPRYTVIATRCRIPLGRQISYYSVCVKSYTVGLLVDTDRLVFYQHNDVTTRETAAYRNYMEVVNAHAVIAASADNSVRGTLKRAVSSGRCHSRRLRCYEDN